MDPEAMYWPVGSNRAAKTSPEWPVSSMTGDCSAVVRGTCCTCQRSVRGSGWACWRTAWMRAPFCAVPLATVRAVLSVASGFARLTSWLEPKASLAGRFSLDMAGVHWIVGALGRCDVSSMRVPVPVLLGKL
jgi:hypothetical protein